MRYRFAYLSFLVSLLLFLPAPAGAEGADNAALSPTVTFEEAVRAALSRGRDVRLAAQDVRITAEGRTQAAARRLPRIDAGADFTALSEQPSIFMQGREVQTADQNIFRARVTAEQTIYDFGKTGSRVDQAEARYEGAERQEGLTRERHALDAVSAFLSALRAWEIRKVAEESLATATEHRRVAGNQYELGVVAKNDVLAADVQVANAEGTLISAGNQVELSRSRLALRMGYPGDRSVTPAPGPFPAPPGDVPPFDESLRAALAKRNELRAQAAFIREGAAQLSGAKSEFAPTLFGQGGYSYENNSFNPNQSVFSLLLGGKVNLFSGFSDDAAKRQTMISLERRKEGMEKLRDEISLEVKAAHLAVAEAAKKRAIAEVAVARAEENLRIQNDRYREGLAISTEVLDAQTLLTRARVDLQNSGFDLSESRFRLLAVRGELLDFLIPLIGLAR
jgi:outer membrane protein TolC